MMLEGNLIHGANLLLGIGTFLWLVIRTSSRWGEYPHEVGLLLLLSINLLFGLLVVSGRQLLANEGVSFDAIVITAVKLSALYILWKTDSTLFRTGTRSVDDSSQDPNDTDAPNRNISA